MRAIGLTCGVGSMLIGAKRAGFKIVGNIEWRKYYNTGTFEHNFPGAFYVKSIDDLEEVPSDIDLAMGHPECGNYSHLSNSIKARRDIVEMRKDPSDIPLFIDLVQRIKPRYFVMDNLVPCLKAVTMGEWERALPEYDLFPELISNFHYGNVQKARVRLFMIGALKRERFTFIPGEEENTRGVKDVIGDIMNKGAFKNPKIKNHLLKPKDWICGHVKSLDGSHFMTCEDTAERLKKMRSGEIVQYKAADGTMKSKIGVLKLHWEKHSNVLNGGECHFHPVTGWPLTCRERARIQGAPDDFEFIFRNEKEAHGPQMIKQTGKFMPVEFCEFVSRQIKAHMEGKEFKASGKRIISMKPVVSEAKETFCHLSGYSVQIRACNECWLIICKNKGTTAIPTPRRRLRRVPRARLISQEKEEVKSLPAPSRTKQPATTKKRRMVDKTEIVHLERMKKLPEDYHCNCKYCQKLLGIFRREDGTPYSKIDRRAYYDHKAELVHGAKTPLHLARGIIQMYSKKGDWIFDPTSGCGTTLVEALNNGRNAAGIELEFSEIIKKNIEMNKPFQEAVESCVFAGDAREAWKYLKELDKKITLVVNNPPYFGDQRQKGVGMETMRFYAEEVNLALFRENDEYYTTMEGIYSTCYKWLKPGGRIVVGVKDTMQNKQPYLLHKHLAEVLEGIGMEYEGMILLPHYPPTLFMSTYPKFYPDAGQVPRYQTIIIFKKKGGK